jgi:hypothetical protein
MPKATDNVVIILVDSISIFKVERIEISIGEAFPLRHASSRTNRQYLLFKSTGLLVKSNSPKTWFNSLRSGNLQINRNM